MLIALTGFMGSGKSTVGRILADALGCPFIDLDHAVVRQAGQSIPEIFQSEGETGFRHREKQVLEQVLKKYASGTAVLSLGGGSVTIPGVVALLRVNTLCIYLQASLETLKQRLDGKTESRPLAGEGLAERLAQREPLYESAAHITLATDALSPEETADEIILTCL